MLEMNLTVDATETNVPLEDGFHGELSSEFISYEDLSNLVGVFDGVSHNEGAGWLRFGLDGVELIVAKRTMRYGISWNQLNAVNVVYGNRVIQINDKIYRIRLLKGADEDPTVNSTGRHVVGTYNSEWTRLFYPIVSGDFNIPLSMRNPNAPYTNSDLGLTSVAGGRSWCQESRYDGVQRVIRGYEGVTYFSGFATTNTNTNNGWRPCLELIP